LLLLLGKEIPEDMGDIVSATRFEGHAAEQDGSQGAAVEGAGWVREVVEQKLRKHGQQKGGVLLQPNSIEMVLCGLTIGHVLRDEAVQVLRKKLESGGICHGGHHVAKCSDGCVDVTP
jgi:hypothetical protein